MNIQKIKKQVLLLFVATLIIGINSCNNPIMEDELISNDLKSAKVEKQSYIVVLSDSGLDEELGKLKGYAKKGQAVNIAAARVLKRAGIADASVGYVYSSALTGFSVMIPPGQLKKLQDDPSVSKVERDLTISVNPIINKKPDKPGGGGGGSAPAQEVPWGITRVGGGSVYNGTGVAWIIDSGIDLDHPDLNVDVERSRTFLGKRSTPDDQNGHGTHVAGTIAAIDNNIGVVGVAPGASVISVRVLDRRGSGSYSGVIAGVDYVAANGQAGDVANMSLGGGVSSTLDDAVVAASGKVKFSLAAGNESDDANNHSPARANGANIYTVSAMDNNDDWAYFSNYGNPPVDFCAPGMSIVSSYKDGAYASLSGTSMAAPHVAGLLLLGNVTSDGTVNGDPDGDADPIAHN